MDDVPGKDIDFKEVASQLRKPDGEFGKVVAHKMNEGNKVITDLTYNSISKFNGVRILEIGFGNGFFIPELLKKGHEKICGIDYSELMHKEASEFLSHLIKEEKVELKSASASAIPYPDNYFDKICSINTIYFWDDIEKIIEELDRVLKSGGYLSIGFRSKERMKDLEFSKHGFNLYSIDDVENLFVSRGFKHVQTEVVDEEIYDAVCVTLKKE